MEEYRILWDSPSNIQKWLNQWKHQYYIDIMQAVGVDPERKEIVLILMRTPRNEEPNSDNR